jgi:HD-like signal output (HDOD) protein
MNDQLQIDLQPAVRAELRAAAGDLRRTLASPRSSRRDVVRGLERLPDLTERLLDISLPLRRGPDRRASLEAAVALVGFARIETLLGEYLATQV